APRWTLTGRSRGSAKVTNCVVAATLAIGCGAGAAEPRTSSPRMIRTGCAGESSKLTISAVSAFSGGGAPVSFVEEAPRTTLTELHPVSGNVTNWMLLSALSIARSAASAVNWRLGPVAAPGTGVIIRAIITPARTLAHIPCRIDPPIGAGDPLTPNPRLILPEARSACHQIDRSTSIGCRPSTEGRSMTKVLVIHGAGMNMRGKVQTEIFGPMTLPEYDER